MATDNDFQLTIQRIKAKINISDVIGKDVKLIRKGHYFSGLCPFHQEKSPSFSVDDGRGQYNCFGCGQRGDVFQYLQDKKNMTFKDALDHMATLSGVELPKTQTQKTIVKVDDDVYKVLSFSATYFASCLRQTIGHDALLYFKKRGLSDETVAHFQLGFAPDKRYGLAELLTKNGFSENAIKKSGMLIYPEDGTKPFDRFRGRVMFPIYDLKGRVIAFGGRLIHDGHPKYLNSPETPTFQKGHLVYNIHNAREAAAKSGIIVVEGYMDVISLHQFGLKNAVAPLGTAITEDQIHLLWKYTPTPLFCLDGDDAGQKAAYRVAEKVFPLLSHGKSVAFSFLPNGEDPDSLCQKDVNGFKKLLDAKKTLSDFFFDQFVTRTPYKTPEDKAQFKHQLRSYVSSIKDLEIRKYYGLDYKNKIEELFFTASRKNFFPEKTSAFSTDTVEMRKKSFLNYKILLAKLINHPYLIHEVSEELAQVNFPVPEWNDLKNYLLEHGHMYQETLTLDKQLLSLNLLKIAEDVAYMTDMAADVNLEPDAKIQNLKTVWLDVWRETIFKKNLDDEINDTINTTKRILTQENWEKIKQLKLKSRSLT
jgi:DNA primase